MMAIGADSYVHGWERRLSKWAKWAAVDWGRNSRKKNVGGKGDRKEVDWEGKIKKRKGKRGEREKKGGRSFFRSPFADENMRRPMSLFVGLYP